MSEEAPLIVHHGFRMSPTRDITKHDVALMCRDLERHYQVPFTPEAISEGGIVWIDQGERYKSIRVHFNDGYPRWPIIRGGEAVDWLNDHSILCPRRNRVGEIKKIEIVLKSQGDGLEWTRENVRTIADVFEANGFKVFRSTGFKGV